MFNVYHCPFATIVKLINVPVAICSSRANVSCSALILGKQFHVRDVLLFNGISCTAKGHKVENRLDNLLVHRVPVLKVHVQAGTCLLQMKFHPTVLV